MTDVFTKKLAQLPFVSINEGQIDLWSPLPTGDDKQDYKTAFEYGCEMAAFLDQCADHPAPLNGVVSRMVENGQFGPLEVGFIDAIGLGALFLHNSRRYGFVARGCYDEPIVFPGHLAPKSRPWRLPSSLRQSGDEPQAA